MEFLGPAVRKLLLCGLISAWMLVSGNSSAQTPDCLNISEFLNISEIDDSRGCNALVQAKIDIARNLESGAKLGELDFFYLANVAKDKLGEKSYIWQIYAMIARHFRAPTMNNRFQSDVAIQLMAITPFDKENAAQRIFHWDLTNKLSKKNPEIDDSNKPSAYFTVRNLTLSTSNLDIEAMICVFSLGADVASVSAVAKSRRIDLCK